MKNKIIVVGDLHLRDKKPYFNQTIHILESIFNNEEYNNPDNILLLLGDLIEKINASYEIVQVYIDLFLNKSKFKIIKILKGNHDSALLKDSNNDITQSTVLSVFTPFKNVEVIDSWGKETIDNIKVLYLPHYDHEGTDKEPLETVYSRLGNEITEEFDYGFTHVEDETSHFGSKFCDLSKLKVKQYLNGHIHTQNITEGGRFLGSPGFNSSSEKDKAPYIAVIDTISKKYELVAVEKYIDYLEVIYPNEPPISKRPYPIYTIFDSLDKEESISFYSKKISPFYCRKVFSKRGKEAELITSSDYKEKNILDYFNDYSIANKLDKDISEICIETLKKV